MNVYTTYFKFVLNRILGMPLLLFRISILSAVVTRNACTDTAPHWLNEDCGGALSARVTLKSEIKY